jgi:trimethylamine--corrinoid protein Co-methyltransferase
MAAASNDAAICVLSMAMAGGSSPVNLAGTLVNHNAEVLAGITLAQLTKRGAKVIYGSSSTAMNLKNASAVVGTPELAMINAAVAAMARYYLLPSWVAGG